MPHVCNERDELLEVYQKALRMYCAAYAVFVSATRQENRTVTEWRYDVAQKKLAYISAEIDRHAAEHRCIDLQVRLTINAEKIQLQSTPSNFHLEQDAA